MNTLLCTTMLLSATLCAPSVHAAADLSAENFYVGAGVGTRGTLNLHGADGKVETSNRPRSYRVFGGYNLNEHFALEAGYKGYGRFKFGLPATVDISAFQVAARGNLQLGESWTVFAKAGASRVKVEQTGVNLGDLSETRPLLGIGAGFAVTKNIGLELEFLDSGSIRSDRFKLNLRQLQANVKYSF